MDWDYVLQELEALPAEYKEIRFQPLKHVVEVFSSPDPPGLTNEASTCPLRSEAVAQAHAWHHHPPMHAPHMHAQIRESGERLGAVLDDIVAAYYTVSPKHRHRRCIWHVARGLRATASVCARAHTHMQLLAWSQRRHARAS